MSARLNDIIHRERSSFSLDVLFAAAMLAALLLAYFAMIR